MQTGRPPFNVQTAFRALNYTQVLWGSQLPISSIGLLLRSFLLSADTYVYLLHLEQQHEFLLVASYNFYTSHQFQGAFRHHNTATSDISAFNYQMEFPSFRAFFRRDQDVQKKAEIFTAMTVEAWLVLYPETHVLRVCCACEAVSMYKPGLENRIDRPWDECIPCGPNACKVIYATTDFEMTVDKGHLYPIRCCWCWRMGSCISRRNRSCGYVLCCQCDSPHSRTLPNKINSATLWAMEDLIMSSMISTLQARNTPIRQGHSAFGKIFAGCRAHAPDPARINTFIRPNPLQWSSTRNRILHRSQLCNDIKTADYKTRLAWLRDLGMLRYKAVGYGPWTESEDCQMCKLCTDDHAYATSKPHLRPFRLPHTLHHTHAMREEFEEIFQQMVLDVTVRPDTSPQVWLRALATLLEFREKKTGGSSEISPSESPEEEWLRIFGGSFS